MAWVCLNGKFLIFTYLIEPVKYRPDNTYYKGPWKDGKQNGQALFIDIDGNEKLGVWVDGQLLKWIKQ